MVKLTTFGLFIVFQGTLNASASIDPDFLGLDGIEIAWYCRDVDENDFVLSNITNEALVSIPQADSNLPPLSSDVSRYICRFFKICITLELRLI